MNTLIIITDHGKGAGLTLTPSVRASIMTDLNRHERDIPTPPPWGVWDDDMPPQTGGAAAVPQHVGGV